MKKFRGLSLIFLGISLSLPATAELQLPNAQDRRPNLSQDPFERAREAIKRLPPASPASSPSSAPAERAPQDVPREPPPRAPVDVPPRADVAAPDAGGGGEPVDEPKPFSQELVATGAYFTLIKGGDMPPLQDGEPAPPNSAGHVLIDYQAEISTSALNLWDDGLFFLHVYGFAGNTATTIVGDLHGVSAIDTGTEQSTYRLWEAWYEHNFPYNKSSFALGVLDFNSEFYVLEYANLFFNGSFGYGNDMGVSANPPTFPISSLGLRFKTLLRENSYFQIGIYDGNVSGPETNYDFTVGGKEGTFTIGELGFFAGEPGADGYYKVGLGGWYLRKDIEYYTGDELAEGATPPAQFEHPVPGTNGVYIIAETAIGDGLGLFFKAGWTDPLYNRYSVSYSAGLNYSGLVPGRADDIMGVGIGQTRQGENFLNDTLAEDGSPSYYSAETTIEVTYSARVMDWLVVQPDLQFIQQPSMSLDIGDAYIFGVQVQANY